MSIKNFKKCLIMMFVLVALAIFPISLSAAVTGEPQMTVNEGQRMQLFNPGGYEFTVADAKICNCSKKGVVIAKKRGQTRITMRNGNRKSSIKLIVLGKPNSIRLKKTNVLMRRGEKYTLQYILSPYSYCVAIQYTASNNVVTINRNGIITAKRCGSCIVRLKTSNGKTATCTVKVSK